LITDWWQDAWGVVRWHTTSGNDSTERRKTFPEIRVAELRSLPLPFRKHRETFQSCCGPHNGDDVAWTQERSLDILKKRIGLRREIDATGPADRPLVYELYGLSEEEIQIVEEATA